MKKICPYWKTARLLWVLIAIVSGIAASFSFGIATGFRRQSAHVHVRVERLIDELSHNAEIEQELASILDDWNWLMDRTATIALWCFCACGLIVLLSSWGSRLNKPFKQLEEDAQQQPAP